MFRKTVNGSAPNHGDTQRALASADHVGKVFVAFAQGMRRCLICDDVFTPRGAAEHAEIVCYPT